MRKSALVFIAVPWLAAACSRPALRPDTDVFPPLEEPLTNATPAPSAPNLREGTLGAASDIEPKGALGSLAAGTARGSGGSMHARAAVPPRAPAATGGGAAPKGAAAELDDTMDRVRPAPAPPGAFFRSAQQASSIAAGEWDDNANYHEFQKWLGTESSVPYRHVDVSHRRFLVVRDESGKAVPGCRVEVTGDQGAHASFLTGPSGRALFFPRAEGFDDGGASATATCEGERITRDVPLGDSDGVVDLRLPVSRTLPAVRTIDVAFILDTTGSMGEEIQSVKATIAKVAAGLGQKDVEVRIGLVEYEDRSDSFVTRVYPFTGDVKGFAEEVSGLSAAGGGDTPESVNEGIHVALTGLDWQSASVGRFAFLIGDAPPHLDYAQDFSYAADMKNAAHRGIQIFTIAASGMDDLGQVVWRQIAQYTNGANMFVLRGGAGPRSVGGGDPKSSCGGTHTSYSSGNLDALILGKIAGELQALNADPMKLAGLHEDENVKPCDQRVVMK